MMGNNQLDAPLMQLTAPIEQAFPAVPLLNINKLNQLRPADALYQFKFVIIGNIGCSILQNVAGGEQDGLLSGGCL